jgi:hypothetical protein
MKKKNVIRKMVSLAVVMAMVFGVMSLIKAGGYFQQEVENDFIRKAKSKFDSALLKHPEDRVYMQFDKPFYKPGETIWFAAYLRNGKDFTPSEKSDILHVQLIGPKGNIEKEIKLIGKNGKTIGDFTIAAESPGGLYKVKAFTNWQKNETDTVFFEKELTVQDVVLPNLKMKLDFERKAFGPGDEVIAKLELYTNENQPLANYNFKYVANLEGRKLLESTSVTGNDGIMYIHFKLPENLKTNDGLVNVLIDYQGQTESVSRSIPIVLNNINFAMYPEGGDLVNDLESRVAFRALNEFGKPADVEGDVFDSNNKLMTHFSSYHQGMGAFNIKPEGGKRYFVKITKPENIKEKYDLTEPMPRGYVLSTDNVNKNELVLNVKSTETEELSVIAQTRGKICYATSFAANAGNNKLILPANQFPIGVFQITLFDSKGIERAERLVFLNKNKQLSIAIETDKEKYLPREKVKMTVTIRDDHGMPMPASLSMSVVNDQLLSFADDKSGNILSKLLLENDIKGKVEEPAFYFNTKEPKADVALDYLLMTAGWRRFTWKKIMDNDLPNIAYQGERAILSGSIIDQQTTKPISKAKIKINGIEQTISVNENGEFYIDKLDLSNPTNITLNAEGYTPQTIAVYDYKPDAKYYLTDQTSAVYSRAEMNMGARMQMPAAVAIDNILMVQGNAWNDQNVAAPMAPKMAKVNNQNAPKAKPCPAKMNDKAKIELKADQDVANAKDEDQVQFLGNAEEKAQFNNKMVARKAGNMAMAGQRFRNPNAETPPAIGYYRAKEFPQTVYATTQDNVIRNDFRSTIYWNGNVDVDRTGKGVVEFYNSDDISSFRATVEGISADGMIGRTEKTYFTQLPFAMTVKAPVEVATEDKVSIPLTLKNNTNSSITGTLNVKAPAGFKEIIPVETTQTLSAGQVKVIYLDYQVMNTTGDGDLDVSFNSFGLNDAFTQKMKIVAKGFPVTISFSGKEATKEYEINIQNVVDGSLTAQLTAYPSVVGDLMSGVEGILREPNGCFEQTSMSSYPNVMVMNYLKETDNKDDKLLASASGFVDRGYKRLTTFETKDKGYEWFGGSPAHEALTAYGLMQFNDMKAVDNNVDQKMIDRTADWLMSRKDGNGGFKRNPRALDNFGGAPEDITNAYIVYALTEAGYNDLEKEIDLVQKKAVDNKDPYQLALLANTLFKRKEIAKAEKVLAELLTKQNADGSWTGTTSSITRSGGKSLSIETTSLAVLAIMQSTGNNMEALNKAIQYIVGERSGYGAFGSTQGTILALKALTEYAKFSKHTSEDGTIEFYVDGRKVAEKSYKAGDKEAIVIDGLAQYIKAGKHDLKVKYVGVKNPLPYSIAVSYNTFLPNSSKDCKVSIETKLFSNTIKTGETVRLSATLTNTTKEGLPSTMAIIGIPAGLSPQPWQLKEMQEKHVFDYYEVKGNSVICYYRQMAPSEIKNINFDLKADMPGSYDSPASSAYLYYTNEYKCWTSTGNVIIKKMM